MRKSLLHSVLVMALAFGSSMTAWADSVLYGLIPSYTYGAQTTSFDLDAISTESTTTVAPGFAFAEAKDVKCGVTAGNKYYAFVTMEDADSGEETTALVTINFTTGNIVVVNNFSYGYGKPGYNVSGMTYDEQSGTLYAIEIGFGDDDDYVTNLYSVSQESGEMTLAATWKGQYQAIASDNNGGFYLVQNVTKDMAVYPNLYHVDASFGVSANPVVSNADCSTGWSSYNSMVAADDNVYLVCNKNVICFDTALKTLKQCGSLSSNVAAVSYGKSSEDGTPATPPAGKKKQTRFLVEKKTYGTSMGDVASDVETVRDFYYYNTAGQLIGSTEYGRNYENGGFDITNMMKSVFDDNGNIVSKDYYQWGNYDYDDYTWKKTANSEKYVYDEDGHLTSDSVSYQYNEYTYNEDGTVATKATYSRSSKSLIQKLTYSNYDEQGNPWHYSSDGTYDSYKYEVDLAYDDDGNKVEEFQYTVTEDPQLPGETITKPLQVEEWTYEGGILRKYEKNSFDEQGDVTPVCKTLYTPVNGNINEIAVADSSYYGNGKWYEEARPVHLVYADFTDMDEMTAMESMATSDPDQLNTTDIMFTLPPLAMSQQCKMIVYRDCLPIDTISPYDLMDEETGLCVYKDSYVKNGSYTYFLMPVFSALSEEPLALAEGEDGTGEDNTEWVSYFASNPMDITFDTELPAVTDLKLVGGKVEITGSMADLRKNYYADIAWNNPADMDKYLFVKNSLYFEDSGLPNAEVTDASANTTTMTLDGYDTSVYVVTTYKLGKVKSESVSIKIKDIDELATGVETVTVGGVANATFSGNVLTLDSAANVSVFTVTGQNVYAADNVSSVDLGTLPHATYIVSVEKGGKVSAYKYSVK